MNNNPDNTIQPQRHPAMLAVTMLALGILTGRVVDVIVVGTQWEWLAGDMGAVAAGAVILALVALFLAVRRNEGLASTVLFGAVFVMGMMLIWHGYGGERHEGTLLPDAVNETFTNTRHGLAAIYRRCGLSGDAYSVVAAMTLGERQGLSPQLREVYAACGASHVFAISGLHLSMIFLIMRHLLPIHRHPLASSAALSVLLWCYVLLVGAPPSTVRAAVMLTAYLTTQLLWQRHSSVASLSLAAFVVLLFRPAWLFDVGFQMSFLAVLGISIFYGPLIVWSFTFSDLRPLPLNMKWRMLLREDAKYHTERFVRWLWGLAVVSLTAQLLVAPLSAYYFGRFSPWFLLSNYIVSPTAFLIITLSALLPLLSPLSSQAFLPAEWVASALTCIVEWLNGALGWVAQLPGS